MLIRHRLLATTLWLALLASLLVAAPPLATAGIIETPPVIITEVMQNPNAVLDGAGEWFEVYNAGVDPVDISGWTVRDLGTNSFVVVDAAAIPAGAYYVLGNNGNTSTNGGVGVDYVYGGDMALANGDDEIVLEDAEGNEVDRIEWDGGPTWPDPTGASMTLGDLEADNNVGTNWCEATSAFGAGDLGTPGAVNDTCGGGGGGGDFDCTTPATFLIHEIQGPGTTTSLEGQPVIVQAVVVGDFQNAPAGADGDLNGFFLQEEDADADGTVETSEGIFVFDGTAGPILDVAVGDLVTIQGTATEFGGTTQIAAIDVAICNTGVTLPSPGSPTMPFGEADGVPDQERFEGMLVTFPQTLYVSEFFNTDRFGEVLLSSQEFKVQPTQVFEPGSIQQQDLAALNASDIIVLDDGQTAQNPAIIPFVDAPVADQVTYTDNLRRGQSTDFLTGVINEAFGAYRVQVNPTTVSFDPSSRPRPAGPAAVGGSLSVASFNVLNYFTTLDQGTNTTETGQDPRGADSAEELTRQTDKLVQALAALDADVVGLVELENDSDDGNSALEALVAALNAEVGAGTYDAIRPGVLGGDAIRVGIIYKPATATPVGAFAVLDGLAFTDDPGGEPRNRPALAQTFADADGGMVTIAVNHFKSKSGSETDDSPNGICVDADAGNDTLDCDQGDGQGFFNATRTNAATQLVAWLDGDPTGSGDPDTMILGDLNAYAMEDPIDALVDAGYVDLAGPDEYSYLFDGQEGTLDYVLANETLASQVTGAAEFHINADEADLIDYNLDFGRDPGYFNGTIPVRSSDHDPLLVGLALSGDALTCDGQPVTIAGTDGPETLTGTDGPDVIHGLGGDDTILGLAGDDVICGGDGNDRVLGSDGDDRIFGEAGDDRIDAGGGDDHVEGGDGEDDILGGKSNDTLLGGADRDVIRGQGGRDTIEGGDGGDTLYGNDGRDFVYGQVGDDIIYGGQGSDRLFGGEGNDEIDGATGNDTLRGEAGDDTLLGGDDDDKLVGGPDTDTCDGQAGVNTTISCEL